MLSPRLLRSSDPTWNAIEFKHKDTELLLNNAAEHLKHLMTIHSPDLFHLLTPQENNPKPIKNPKKLQPHCQAKLGAA